ncbi:MAG: spore coat U domain-containing protein [Acidobacteriota bacterium]|nr:spore coat U domain-containing protein [Acidobacteriota bacterium]
MSVRLQQTALIALLLLTAVSGLADGRATLKIDVTALVTPNCRMTLTPLTFGNYDPLGSNASQQLDATATLSLTCTRNSIATIAIDQGQNPAGGNLTRRLAAGDQRLDYEIYRDAARTETWSVGTNAVRYVSAAGVSSTNQLMVYGRIPSGQEVAAGSYNDVVTATVDF